MSNPVNEAVLKQQNELFRAGLKNRDRIVVKIGSSSLMHPETGRPDLIRMEVLVRELCDLQNRGKDVILVSSGAIAVGRGAMHFNHKPQRIDEKQACAAIGQAKLMMIYQKLFQEYSHTAAQILLTKDTIEDPLSRHNTIATFEELLRMSVIPIVNENDTIATYEIQFGDNDSLSALVAALVHADLLIMLSDIDGLYTDDPHSNPNARFIPMVTDLDSVMHLGKGAGSDVGTGGMATKLHAAQICRDNGVDMIIANSSDFRNIHRVIDGDPLGTLFAAPRY